MQYSFSRMNQENSMQKLYQQFELVVKYIIGFMGVYMG